MKRCPQVDCTGILRHCAAFKSEVKGSPPYMPEESRWVIPALRCSKCGYTTIPDAPHLLDVEEPIVLRSDGAVRVRIPADGPAAYFPNTPVSGVALEPYYTVGGGAADTGSMTGQSFTVGEPYQDPFPTKLHGSEQRITIEASGNVTLAPCFSAGSLQHSLSTSLPVESGATIMINPSPAPNAGQSTPIWGGADYMPGASATEVVRLTGQQSTVGPPYTINPPISGQGVSFSYPETSDWVCYMFGGSKEYSGIMWRPIKGKVPNAFIRWMMKVCFACTWVKEK